MSHHQAKRGISARAEVPRFRICSTKALLARDNSRFGVEFCKNALCSTDAPLATIAALLYAQSGPHAYYYRQAKPVLKFFRKERSNYTVIEWTGLRAE
ncbi:hypothetical protein [Pseudoflavonifractor sp. 524-17]|uniref:hypothetical protein n=1 Tax=Pseudoflavonifractor sp. 524-17 TaxID=2304577 RepID=UPI001379E247|nr:hypothetical protein [Pseudoflavonifractor sp. 524-17]